jgi:predicted metal-dependent HD superfamily phosphohydrolase
MDLSPWWPGTLPDDLRARLEAAYDDPGRGYHDLLHLGEVLQRLDELVPPDLPGRDAVLLAAWFHDAVYDTGGEAGHGAGVANEERSARLAEAELVALDAPLVAEVARLVRLTETHRPADDDLHGQLLCDADLAILAAPPERYAAYVAGVRTEYAAVPEPDFRAGRRAVLEDLLAKPTLFHSAAARERWESTARANLTAEVAELS